MRGEDEPTARAGHADSTQHGPDRSQGQPWAVPEPFRRHDRRSGLTEPWEPIYSYRTTDAVVLGLRAAAAHANSRGFVHGGLLSALADNAMGLSCVLARGDDGARLVTVSLAMDFLGTARLGEWIEIRPSVLKSGARLSFATALLSADGRLCARANASFASPAR